MKSLALLLITLASFAAIYFWLLFDRKSAAVSPKALAASWLGSLWAKTAELPPGPAFPLPEVPIEGANLNFQNDLESEKVRDAKVVEACCADSDPDDAGALAPAELADSDRSSSKRRQLEKLKDLVDQVKSVPVPPSGRKRGSRSQARYEARAAPDCKIWSKLNTIERAIKARRGDCFLAAIPEALQSRDSFTT